MNPAPVVMNEVQCDCGPMAFDILAEGVGEPRQTPDLHTHCQVWPLHMRSADPRRFRFSADHNWDSLHDLSLGLALLVGLRLRVEFYELRVITSIHQLFHQRQEGTLAGRLS
jgi:hypothetical protein